MDFAALLAQIGGALSAQAAGGSQGLQQFMSNMSRMASQELAMDFEREQRASQNASQLRDKLLTQAHGERMRRNDQAHELFLQQREFDQRDREKGLVDSKQASATAAQMTVRAGTNGTYAQSLMQTLSKTPGIAVPDGVGVTWLATPEGQAATLQLAKDLGNESVALVGDITRTVTDKREQLSGIIGHTAANATPVDLLDGVLQSKRGPYQVAIGKVNNVTANFASQTKSFDDFEQKLSNLPFNMANGTLRGHATQYARAVQQLEDLRAEQPELFVEGSDLAGRYAELMAMSKVLDSRITYTSRSISDMNAARVNFDDPLSFVGFTPGYGGNQNDFEDNLFKGAVQIASNSEAGEMWDSTANVLRTLSAEDAEKLGVLPAKQALARIDARLVRKVGADATDADRAAARYEKAGTKPATISTLLKLMREHVGTDPTGYNSTDMGSGVQVGPGMKQELGDYVSLVRDINAARNQGLPNQVRLLGEQRNQLAQARSKLTTLHRVLGGRVSFGEDQVAEIIDQFGSPSDPNIGYGKVFDDVAFERFKNSTKFTSILIDKVLQDLPPGIDPGLSARTDLEFYAGEAALSEDATIRAMQALSTVNPDAMSISETTMAPVEVYRPSVVRAQSETFRLIDPEIKSNADAINAGVAPNVDMTSWEYQYGRAAVSSALVRTDGLNYTRELTKGSDIGSLDLVYAETRDADGRYRKVPMFADPGLMKSSESLTPYDAVNVFSDLIPEFRAFATDIANERFVNHPLMHSWQGGKRGYLPLDRRPGSASGVSYQTATQRGVAVPGDGTIEGAMGARLGVSGDFSTARTSEDRARMMGARMLDAVVDFNLESATDISDTQRAALENIQGVIRGMTTEQRVQFALDPAGLPIDTMVAHVAQSTRKAKPASQLRLSGMVHSTDTLQGQINDIEDSMAKLSNVEVGSRYDADPDTQTVKYTRITEGMKAQEMNRLVDLRDRIKRRLQFTRPASEIASDTRNTFASAVLEAARGEQESVIDALRKRSQQFTGGKADTMTTALGETTKFDDMLTTLTSDLSRGRISAYDSFSGLMDMSSALLERERAGIGYTGTTEDKQQLDQLIRMDLRDVGRELRAVQKAVLATQDFDRDVAPTLRHNDIDPERFKSMGVAERTMLMWALYQTGASLPE
jgi:hypothetical protein